MRTIRILFSWLDGPTYFTWNSTYHAVLIKLLFIIAVVGYFWYCVSAYYRK